MNGVKNKKLSTIDSVFLKDKKLRNEKDSLFIIPDDIGKDSILPLHIFIKNIAYTVDISQKFITNCAIIHKVILFYEKRKLCYRLTDCTSRTLTGRVLKVRKLSKK